MSDLISRSAVIKALEECNLDKNLFEKDVFEKINTIPTAYDVEKVVEIIKKEQKEQVNAGVCPSGTMHCLSAITIIRNGGIQSNEEEGADHE